MNELHDMKLNETMMSVAHIVGPSKFVQLWQVLSDCRNEDGRLFIPAFSRYERAQRNVYAADLKKQGLPDDKIYELVSAAGYKIEKAYLKRLLAH